MVKSHGILIVVHFQVQIRCFNKAVFFTEEYYLRIKINGLNECYIIWFSFLGTNLRQRRLKSKEFVTEIARNVDRLIIENFSTTWWVKDLNKIGILKALDLHCTLHCNAKVKRENYRDAPSFKKITKKCVCQCQGCLLVQWKFVQISNLLHIFSVLLVWHGSCDMFNFLFDSFD